MPATRSADTPAKCVPAHRRERDGSREAMPAAFVRMHIGTKAAAGEITARQHCDRARIAAEKAAAKKERRRSDARRGAPKCNRIKAAAGEITA